MSDYSRIEAFLEMMSAERGASLHTLDAYGRDLLDASEYLDGKLLNASAADLSDWLKSLASSGLASSTQARKLSALRRFFRFLFEDNDRTDNPTSRLEGPKSHRDVPDVLSRAEVARLLEACAEDARLTCLLELLYGAGLRVTELVSLTLGTLPRQRAGRWETHEIIVRGKGGKERLCPLGAPALLAIRNWLYQRNIELGKSAAKQSGSEAFLFPSRGASGHLTRRRLGQLLGELAHTARIDPSGVGAGTS